MFSDIYFRLLLDVMDKDPNIQHTPCNLNKDSEDSSVASVKYYGQLISSAYKQNPGSNIGLVFGKHMSPINGCDFSRLLTTAQHVGQCFDLLVNQYHTLNLKLFPILNVKNRIVSISISFPYQGENNEDEIRFCNETFYSYCLNYLRALINKDINPVRVHLNFPQPQYANQLEDLFRCPIIYDSPISMIEFSEDIMSLELPSWNKSLHEVYFSRAQESWKAMKRLQSFRYRAVTILMTRAPKGFNTQYMAEEMSISTRGLQKRLSAEGSSFSHICQQARRELTKVCLFQLQLSLEDTAFTLGFQTQASFRRFFKGNFKMGPKEFLKEHRTEEQVEEV
ncbi:MAG: AraC family transcriptional regulator ligand-binding domain-containing protein [Bermanella sp.]